MRGRYPIRATKQLTLFSARKQQGIIDECTCRSTPEELLAHVKPYLRRNSVPATIFPRRTAAAICLRSRRYVAGQVKAGAGTVRTDARRVVLFILKVCGYGENDADGCAAPVSTATTEAQRTLSQHRPAGTASPVVRGYQANRTETDRIIALDAGSITCVHARRRECFASERSPAEVTAVLAARRTFQRQRPRSSRNRDVSPAGVRRSPRLRRAQPRRTFARQAVQSLQSRPTFESPHVRSSW